MTTGRQAISVLNLSILATGELAEHTAVSWAGLTVAAGAAMAGLTRDATAIGQYAPADVLGTGIAIAGAGVTLGQALEVGAAGALIPHASGIVVARAVEAANTGDEFEVFLLPS